MQPKTILEARGITVIEQVRDLVNTIDDHIVNDRAIRRASAGIIIKCTGTRGSTIGSDHHAGQMSLASIDLQILGAGIVENIISHKSLRLLRSAKKDELAMTI
jgi:hypothetical protein